MRSTTIQRRKAVVSVLRITLLFVVAYWSIFSGRDLYVALRDAAGGIQNISPAGMAWGPNGPASRGSSSTSGERGNANSRAQDSAIFIARFYALNKIRYENNLDPMIGEKLNGVEAGLLKSMLNFYYDKNGSDVPFDDVPDNPVADIVRYWKKQSRSEYPPSEIVDLPSYPRDLIDKFYFPPTLDSGKDAWVPSKSEFFDNQASIFFMFNDWKEMFQGVGKDKKDDPPRAAFSDEEIALYGITRSEIDRYKKIINKKCKSREEPIAFPEVE